MARGTRSMEQNARLTPQKNSAFRRAAVDPTMIQTTTSRIKQTEISTIQSMYVYPTYFR